MTSPFLPRGRYLVAFNQIRTVAGGQTHALLQRTWLFAEEGVASTILTFDAFPGYRAVEADLRERAKLHPSVGLLNVYNWFRDHPSTEWPPNAETDRSMPKLVDLQDLKAVDEFHDDGTVWRTRYDDPINLQPMFFDYQRADGSVFLRTPQVSLDEFRDQPGLVQAVREDGRITNSWPSLGEWFTQWLQHLTSDDDEVFLFYDSMMLPPHLSFQLPPKIHQVATMHMAHVYHPRQWNSTQHEPARRSLEQLSHFDAFVMLTERQRADVELYYGARTNLFVLPNPGEAAAAPNPEPQRDPNRLVVIARLERVKRVDDAIRAFELVRQEAPDARLDVYGEGRLRTQHQQLIDELGLRGSVTLHGHCPDARDRLWECIGLMLTSRSEGYPLAPLEAFARACPVVSYDIKYGPREQIEDGVSGYLAPSGDTKALAQGALRLLGSPDMARRMGEAGLERMRHDRDVYVARWAEILQATVAARAGWTRLETVRLIVDELSLKDPVRRGTGVRRKARKMVFQGRLLVTAAQSESNLSDASVELQAVNDVDGTIVPLPLEVALSEPGPHGEFGLTSRFDLAWVLAQLPAGHVNLRLRLRLTWRNSYWDTNLRRPQQMAPDIEAAFLDDGQIRIRADTASP